MIYFEPELQQRLIPVFHYALKTNGFLLLGGAENIGRFSHLFEAVAQKAKLFRKRSGSRDSSSLGGRTIVPRVPSLRNLRNSAEQRGNEITRKADKALMDRFCPPLVVVNQDLEILQFRGGVTPYLQPASGKASLNLFSMTLPALEFELRSLIDQAKHDQRGTHREGLQVEIAGMPQRVDLEVIPIGGTENQGSSFIIAFVARPGTIATEAPGVAQDARKLRIAQLEKELLAAKQKATSPFYRLFQTVPEKTEGRLFYEAGNGEWDIPELRSLLENVLLQNERVENFEIRQSLPSGAQRKLLIQATRTKEMRDHDYFIVVSIEDVTARAP